jgi:hypothetical protein
MGTQNDEVSVGVTAHDSSGLGPKRVLMANQSKSGLVQFVGSRPELVLRDVEHQEVFLCGTWLGHTTLVTRELNVPVAARSADECTVATIVSREPAKVVEAQKVDGKAKGCRDLTYWSGNSHRGR